MKTDLLSLSVLCALASAASAHDQRPFPMRALEAPMPGVLDLQPLAGELADLGSLTAVTLTDVVLPDRAALNLELTRIQHDWSSIGMFVDGQPATFDPGDMTLWKGKIEGVLDSDVMLTLSSVGCYGWINDGVHTTHLTAAPAADGTWNSALARWITDEAMRQADPVNLGPCMSEHLEQNQRLGSNPGNAGGSPAAGNQTLELKMAIETDYQLYQLWNNLTAETNYIMALLAASSDRYLTEINVIQTFPYVQFYTNSNDPWDSQDSGGNSVNLLYEFRDAWQNNIPNGAHLAAFLSGASLGGGVAWLDALCSGNIGFSVSGNINGGVTFPITQGSNTWDFMVYNHEVGHNVGTTHTHNYCPPLDECAPSGYFGNCQNQQNCTSQGTIMSYCHLCSGGMSNITTYFHPTVKNHMRTDAENSCLPDYNGGGPQVLFFDDFESGDYSAGGWTTSHSGRCKVHSSSAYNGGFGGKLKKGGVGTGACTFGTEETWVELPTLDTTGFSQVDVNFWGHVRQNELSCEYLDLQYWNGASWVSVAQIEDHVWGSYSISMPAGATNNANLRIRFQTNCKGAKERAEIDDVEVIGTP